MAVAYDDNGNPDDPTGTSTAWAPGTPGYRLAPWAPDYDPGPNWNNGIAPGAPSGRYDYNNGSPVNDPSEQLRAGNGWEWQGPQTPQWDMDNRQWNRGVWNQVTGRGLGYTAPTNTTTTTTTNNGPGPTGPTGPAPTGGTATGGGGVSSLPTAGSVSSTLPPDIAALFSQVPTKTPVQSAYQDALLKYLGKAQETPSLDDPTLAPQVEVYRAQAQRGQERQRLAASERAAATGQSESGYLDNLIMKGIQDQAMNTAGFNANLLGGEMNKRRDELQAGLRLAAATGDAESARELQTRLAQVDAMMQQQNLGLQSRLGEGDLNLRWGLGMEGLNQRALEIIMGGL
jgi:hypothetical protein